MKSTESICPYTDQDTNMQKARAASHDTSRGPSAAILKFPFQSIGSHKIVSFELNLPALGDRSIDPSSKPEASKAMVSEVLAQCRTLVPGWANCQHIRAESLFGGLTNIIWRVFHPSGDSVVVRWYGHGTELFFDREREWRICEIISGLGLGPKVVAGWEHGRIEEFAEGQPILLREFHQRDTLQALAQRIAVFHRISGIPLDDDSQLSIHEMGLKRFLVIEEMLCQASRCCQGQFKGLVGPYRDLWRNVSRKLIDLHSPVVMCHNDINEGNILVNRDGNGSLRDMTLIDFEYSDYNFRGFDLGNLLCETYIWNNALEKYPYFQIDRSMGWSGETLREFLRYYVQNYQDCCQEEVNEEYLDSLMFEATAFQCASHVLWAAWALIQIESSPIEWAHEEYARQRLKAFAVVAEQLWNIS